MIDRSLLHLCAAVILISILGREALAQTGIAVEPVDRRTRGFIPESSARGKTVSAAASAAKAAAEWWQQFALNHEVDTSLRKLSPRVADALKTGLPGVLLHGEVAVIRGELDHYSLVGGGLQFIGAGRKPAEVWVLENQRERLKPGVPAGSSVDTDRSFFMWVTKSDSRYEVTTLAANPIINEELRVRSDKVLMAKLQDIAQQDAISIMIKQLEQDTKDRKLRDQIKALNAQADQTLAKLREIDADLAKELEKARKAQAAYANLKMWANILTVAKLAGDMYSEFGNDAKGAMDAKTQGDLEGVVKGIEDSAIKRKDALAVEQKTYLDKANGFKIEQLKILRIQKVDTGDVPALQGLP